MRISAFLMPPAVAGLLRTCFVTAPDARPGTLGEVLSGEVVEGHERHGPGTYVVFAPGSRHRPRTETGARMLGITVLPR